MSVHTYSSRDFTRDVGAAKPAQDNISIAHENLSAANSRIRDTDIAQATSDVTRAKIMQNATVSVLANANMSQQSARKLIG